MTTASAIYEQLGGDKFQVMTGAKALVGMEDGLLVNLPTRFAKNGINKVEIKITPADTYTVRFMRYMPRKLACETISEVENVYAEALPGLFSDTTGLDLTIR